MCNIANQSPSSSDETTYQKVFGRPAIQRTRRRGVLHDVELIRHGNDYCWIRATADIEGVLIRRVLASPAGVVWPSIFGDPVIDFYDLDLRDRAEAALRQTAAREAGRRAA